MADSLYSLFEAITKAQDEQDLRSHVVSQLGEYFAAKRYALFLLEQITQAKTILPSWALSVEHNPVLRYLVERHTVIHEASLLPPGVWENLCSRTDHAHVMVGPIVQNGSLVGAVGFTRAQGTPAFNAENLADLSAVCLHLSTWLATNRLQLTKFNTANANCLTPRELQIAELVADGLTNAEIGIKLWITENSVKQALKRMFRKIEVSSRAAMVARLADNSS